MNEFEGKVALITGGSRGIGAAVAIRLAQGGADVAFTYESNADSAAQVVDQIKEIGRRAVAIQADSASVEAVEGAVEQTVAEFGRLDILVNNAGVFPIGALDDHGIAEFDRTVAVNIRAAYMASRATAKHMSSGGRIVNIGSNVAERLPFPGFTLYTMSKAALAGMTRAMARDLGPQGITVNIVHPGPTNTDLNPADGPNAAMVSGMTALGRYADPSEIAAMVASLAGAGGAYVTGAEVHVDGGFTI